MLLSSLYGIVSNAAKILGSLFIWHDLKSSNDRLNYQQTKSKILSENNPYLREHILYIASNDRQQDIIRNFDLHGILSPLQQDYQIDIFDDITQPEEVNQAIAQIINQKHSIKALLINTHGSPSRLVFSTFGQHFDFTKIRFDQLASDATILVNACNAGRPVQKPHYNVADHIAKLAGPTRQVISPKAYHHVQNLKLQSNNPIDFTMNPFGIHVFPDYSYRPQYEQLPPIDKMQLPPPIVDTPFESNFIHSQVAIYGVFTLAALTLIVLKNAFNYMKSCFKKHTQLDQAIINHQNPLILNRLRHSHRWGLQTLNLAIQSNNIFAVDALLKHPPLSLIPEPQYDKELRSALILSVQSDSFEKIHAIFSRHGVKMKWFGIDNGIISLTGLLNNIFQFAMTSFSLFKCFSSQFFSSYLMPTLFKTNQVKIACAIALGLLSFLKRKKLRSYLTLFKSKPSSHSHNRLNQKSFNTYPTTALEPNTLQELFEESSQVLLVLNQFEHHRLKELSKNPIRKRLAVKKSKGKGLLLSNQ